MYRTGDDETIAAAPAEDVSEDLVTERQWIADSAALVEAVEMFQASPDLRLLPVLDDDMQPVGAILEREMRRILFNPFGHALLKNPSFGGHLHQHVRPCPQVEAGTSTETMLDAYAAHEGRCDGLIVTRDGRFVGVVNDKILIHLAAEREAEIARERAARYERIERASTGFRDAATALAGDLTALSGDLSGAATHMADRARHNGDHACMVANAACQAALNMREIASRTLGLAETLQGVEDRTDEARRVAGQAVDIVTQGGAQMRTLSYAADEIGEVTALIDAIARKTSMLAINATIEASRAGDHGRGFAVVAGEVKSLAAQTRTAASGITRRIANIRNAITAVSAGHAAAEEVIHSVEGMSSSISRAVHDQRVTTEHIARNVEEASKATAHIEGNAVEINRTSAMAAEAATQMQGLSSTLAEQSLAMQRRVLEFIALVQRA